MIEKPLAAVIDGLDAERLADLSPEARNALAALAREVTVDTVRTALQTLGACDASFFLTADVHDALDRDHHATLVAALFPGVTFDADVDVRTPSARPRKFTANWHGDIVLRASTDGPGSDVTVATLRGIEALRALSREQRASIVQLSVLTRDARAHAALRELWFDNVRVLHSHDMSGSDAAALLGHCPLLESIMGNASPELADAVAAAPRTSVFLSGTTDDTLARLARAPRLTELWISTSKGVTSHGLAALVEQSTLRVLHAGFVLGDDALAVIARIAGLTGLHVGHNPITDAGATVLAALRGLRELDLTRTAVGDATARALATLPVLEHLDLADTAVGAAGVSALARIPTLRRLGLSWSIDEGVQAAASRLQGITIVYNDYHSGGSALWGGGFYGP